MAGTEKEIKYFVNKLFKKSGKLIKEENDMAVVATVRIDPEGAYTTISTDRKMTHNLGNYNSCSFSVFMSVPCPLDEDQIEGAYKYVTEFTEKKMEEIMKEIEAAKK